MAVRAWAGKKGRIDARKKRWQQQQCHKAQVIQFSSPPFLVTFVARLLFSFSRSLSITSLEGIRVRRQPTIVANADKTVELILGLDDGSAFAVLHPSIRPPCVLHSPASVLRTTQPEFPRPTRRQRGLASGRNRGTRRGRDNSSGRYLALLLRSRCLGITDLRHRISPRANTKREGGEHPGALFLLPTFYTTETFRALFLVSPSFFLYE